MPLLGALFWQWNDCWLVQSGSVIAWALQPKPAGHWARRACARVLLSLVRDGDLAEPWLVNDLREGFQSEVTVSIHLFGGEVLQRGVRGRGGRKRRRARGADLRGPGDAPRTCPMGSCPLCAALGAGGVRHGEWALSVPSPGIGGWPALVSGWWVGGARSPPWSGCSPVAGSRQTQAPGPRAGARGPPMGRTPKATSTCVPENSGRSGSNRTARSARPRRRWCSSASATSSRALGHPLALLIGVESTGGVPAGLPAGSRSGGAQAGRAAECGPRIRD